MSDILDSPESLLPDGRPKWGTALSGNTITYNFMPALPEVYRSGFGDIHDFAPFTSQQRSAAEEALSVWAEIADVRFERQEDTLIHLADIFDIGLIEEVLDFIGLYDEFADALDDFANDLIEDLIGFRIFPLVQGGDIRFGTSDQGNESSGFAYYPPEDWFARFDELRLDIADFFDSFIDPFRPIIDAFNSIPFGPRIFVPSGFSALLLDNIKLGYYGDVWLNNNYEQGGSGNAPGVIGIKGADGFQTLLHEIGHALGLEHPGDYNAGGGGTDPPYLPTETDNFKYSLMSYTSFDGHRGIFPETPMLYDMAAIQILYGANLQTRTGDDIYSWNQPTVATIWDAGGYDTIDVSNQSGSVIINLNAGEFSSIGQNNGQAMIDNIAIAYNVIIENSVGGQGEDTIIGNHVANFIKGGDEMDSLAGRDGNDTLWGEQFIDSLFGENDDDSLVGGGSGDYLDGGEGNDIASYITAPTAVLLDLATGEKTGDAEGDIFISIEQYRGSLYEDTLIGDEGQTIFFGDQGNDWLIGNQGNDFLHGEEGKDTVEGRTGDDQIFGEPGNDLLYGNEDNDTIWGGLDDDSLHGNDGNDRLMGDEDNDTLNGDLGNDSLEGNDGNDQVMGDGGHDTLNGNLGDDSLAGNDGNDRVMGDEGHDTLNGNLGDDSLAGNDGNDRVMGDGGHDTLNGDLGNDLLRGGTGNDRLDGGDGIDSLYGGFDNDSLTGSIGNDSLFGEELNDNLAGEIGHDYLDGGLGNDVLAGGEGEDVLIGSEGRDTIVGGEGNDAITGSDARDFLTGGTGQDRFIYTNIRDVDDLILDFEVGIDKIVLTQLFQSLNIDVVDYANTINQGYIQYGTRANDTILLLDRDGTSLGQRPRPFMTFDELSVAAIDNAINFVI